MKIMGLQKLTLLDFPTKIACTVFTGGCNFRCPFCHNADLVLGRVEQPSMEEEFFSFLQKRKGILDGVCITGGEPTLQPDLEDVIRRIRSLGYAVKLDTNGFLPQVLKDLVGKGLIDYVAMDIKNAPASYAATAGIPNMDITPILESVSFLKRGEVPFEFRTTVVKELHTPQDMVSIGHWLNCEAPYFLQRFEDSGNLLGQGLHGYDENEMKSLLNLLKKELPNAKIRGI